MQTSESSRLWGLDLLRAIAILAVLLLHTQPFVFEFSANIPRALYFGWAGVDLFFVLSGFLIGSQAYNNREPLSIFKGVKDFWLRRWFRTIPLYLLVLVVYIGIKPLVGYPFQGEVWPFFFFLQNFLEPKDFVQSWSLCIEEQFYFFLPLLFFFLPKFRWPGSVWLLVLALSAGSRWMAWEMNAVKDIADGAYRFQFPTHMHLDGIAMGLFLAATQNHWRSWSVFKKRGLAAASLALLAIVFAFASPNLTDVSVIWVFSGLALGFSGCIPWVYELKGKDSIFHKMVFYIALWSYGLYLWNNLVFRFAEHLPLPAYLQGIIAWALVFVCSACTYYGVEKPFLRWRNRLLRSSH